MELSNSTSEFPKSALCPKSETGVSNFLAKNPGYDGRGVIIAIFDSGVDPGAPGLRETTTGLKKVIERYDCSGAGDVVTSTVSTLSADRTIKGARGNVFKIPENWECPSGSFHVGTKPLYDLYPSKVKERIEAVRREREWDPHLRSALAAASRRLSSDNNNNKTDSSNPTEKFNKEEAEAQVEMLTLLEKKYKDPGPILDCILFNDGNIWRACLHVNNDNDDLSSSLLLGEYSHTQDFGMLANEDQMNVSINVWEDGNRLEIVGMSGSHGTHVASIAAGNFPENPDLNGVAPGAQIASFSIGDSRLNTMETGTALVRAMSHVMRCAASNFDETDKIKRGKPKHLVINMSYGEHVHYSSHGRIGELMKEVVDKYGVTWVASGGNHGPALSTISTPPWVQANTLIGVGAYVSPEMMAAEYSLREKLPGMPYTWTSRGPTPDGDLGISVCAPGGAIASVPGFTLRSAQLMNGTSMAAPHVSGCVALMLSGALQKAFEWSPFSVKKALQNSAVFMPKAEPFAQGHGLVQVEKAFDLLETYSTSVERDVRFNITVTSSGVHTASPYMNKGIYIRDPQINKPKEYSVSIDPIFFKDDTIEPERKIDFRMNLLLVSSVPWLHIPKYFDLANMQRSFNVKVDPEGLPAGVHYSRIDALDVQNLAKGPVFSVDVTIIRAVKTFGGGNYEIAESTGMNSLTSSYFRPTVELSNVVYAPGGIQRHFIQVPKGASWASLNLRLLNGQSSCRFVVHAMCLHAGHSCISEEFYKMVNLQPMEEATVAFSVTENMTLELVVARWWAEPKESATLTAALSFRSVTLNKQELVMSAGDAYSKIVVSNAFSTEEIQPSVILKHQVQLLRPTDVKLSALAEPRDVIPNNRGIYELLSTYNFTLSRATEITINCSLLSDTLYESEYESQLWMIFDSNKRYINAGDAYPSKWVTKLEKGDYILRLSIRHEKREALEKFLNGGGNSSSGNGAGTSIACWASDSHVPCLPVLLSMKLPTNVNLDTYLSLYDIQDFKTTKKGANSSFVMKKECSVNVFVSTFISDKAMKTLPGSSTLYFQGTFTATKDEQGKKVNSIGVKLCVPEAPPKSKSAPSKDPEKTKLEEMEEQIRDMSINWIKCLLPDDSKRVYDELSAKYNNHLPVHVARLNYLDSLPNNTTLDENKKSTDVKSPDGKSREVLDEMVQLSDKILQSIDRSSLLAYYGTKASAVTDAAKTKQVMDKQRSAVLEASVKKAVALSELAKLDPSQSANLIEHLDNIILDVNKFAEVTDSRVLELSIQHALARGNYGRAVRFLYKQQLDDFSKWTAESDVRIVDLFKKLGWKMCVWNWETIAAHRFPKEFRPF